MADREQLNLGDAFVAADAADAEQRAERRAYLVGALARVKASSDLRIFVTAIYRHTGAGGAGRWWSVRIRELCGLESAPGSQLDPLGEILGCSERQAKRVAGHARQLGLVRARPAGRSSSRDEWSELQPGEGLEYSIDWLGVRRLLGLESAEKEVPESDESRGQAGTGRGQAGTGRGQAGTGRGQAGTGENAPIRNKYPGKYPGPVPSRVFESAQIPRDGTGTGAAGPRLLDGLTLGMLGDTREMVTLLGQVCEVSPIKGLTDSEADRLWWLTAAQCALRAGNDPVRYFRWLVQGSAHQNRRAIPTCPDQDAALKRLEEVKLCTT